MRKGHGIWWALILVFSVSLALLLATTILLKVDTGKQPSEPISSEKEETKEEKFERINNEKGRWNGFPPKTIVPSVFGEVDIKQWTFPGKLGDNFQLDKDVPPQALLGFSFLAIQKLNPSMSQGLAWRSGLAMIFTLR